MLTYLDEWEKQTKPTFNIELVDFIVWFQLDLEEKKITLSLLDLYFGFESWNFFPLELVLKKKNTNI